MEETAEPRQTSDSGDFNFYLKFAKPLVFSLADPADRVLAAAWIKKLKNEEASEELRTDYLKLLLFVLHRKKLIGPFIHNPADIKIAEFPEGSNIVDVAHELILDENKAHVKRIQNRLLGAGDFPPYAVEVSSDTLEYAASQEIPRFGVHAFYALSTEPIHFWDNTETGLLPKEFIAEGVKHTIGIASNLSLKPTKSKSLIETPKAAAKPPKPPKPTSSAPKEQSSPRGILGTVVPSPTSDRRPITWGSNLIEVTEPPIRASEYDTTSPKAETPKSFPFQSDISVGPQESIQLEPTNMFSPTTRTPKSPSKQQKLSETSPLHQFDDSVAAMLQVSPAHQYTLDKSLSPAPKRLSPIRLSPIARGPPSVGITRTRPPREAYPSPIASDSIYGVNIMDTSFPNLLDDTFSGSPQRKSPKPPSPLARGSAGSPQSPEGATQITMNVLDEEAREILHEANVTMAEQEVNMQEQSSKQQRTPQQRTPQQRTPQQRTPQQNEPSQYDPYYKHKRMDMPQTPPIFSRYQHVREAPGRPAYSPGQFGVEADEPFQPATDYVFRLEDQQYEEPRGFQYKPGERPFEDLFPDFQPDSTGEALLTEQDDELGDLEVLDEDLHDDLEDQIRRIQQYYALESESLPAGAGVATTTPSLPVTPIRRNDYGVEFPLFEEGVPEMYSPDISPSSKARAQMRLLYEGEDIPPELQSPVPDRYGLPSLITNLPTPPRSTPTETVATASRPSTSYAKSPPKQATPTPKSSKKGTPMKYLTEEEVEKAAEEQYVALYNSLISESKPQAGTPKPSPFKTPTRSPKPPRSSHTPPIYDVHPDDLFGVAANVPYSAAASIFDEDLPEGLESPIKPPTAVFGWQTPPHLRIETPKTPSPYRPYHLGPPRHEDYLWHEEVPEGLYSPEKEPQTPPKAPEAMNYDEYVDPFQFAMTDQSTGYNIFDEEEPLGGKLEAHEMLPYRRQFTVKVGVRAKPVKVPRRSAAPRVSPISEEDEYYYLGSPVQSPGQVPLINFNEPYMLPSSAPQSAQGYYQSPPQQTRIGSPTAVKKTTTSSPAQQAAVPIDQSILADTQEHFATQVEDPQQQELLRRVVHLVEDVGGQEPVEVDTQESIYFGSPPKEFEEVEFIDAASAPPRSVRTPRSPERPETAQQYYDFADPIDEFMPEYGPLDIGGAYDMGIMEEDVPFDSRPRMVRDSPEPPKSPEEFDMNEFIAETQALPENLYTTTYHWVRRGGPSGPVIRALPRPSRRFNKMIPIKELSPSADPDIAPFYYNVELGSNKQRYKEFIEEHRKGVSTVRPSQRLPARRKMQTLTEEIEVDSPVKQGGRPGISKDAIRKRINFDQQGGSPEPPKQPTEYNLMSPQVIPEIGARERYNPPKPQSPTSLRIANILQRNQNLPFPPLTPLPEDLIGVEAPVIFSPHQYLIDQDIQEENLQSPLRPPSTIPGWSTPEHLKIQRTPPQSSPVQWMVPVRHPMPLTDEDQPDFFNEFSPHRPVFDSQPGPSRTPSESNSYNKTMVSKTFQTPDGTTTKTVETVETTSPRQMTDISQQQQVENYMSIADQQYAALSEEEPSTPKGQRISDISRSPRTPKHRPNEIWNELPDDMQTLDTMSPPQMYEYEEIEMQSPGTSAQTEQLFTIPPDILDELTYRPQADQLPIGPNVSSPEHFKSPGMKRTTIIHEERPLLDRVERIVEEIEIDPIETQRPVSPEMQFQWQTPPRHTPPRPDLFDTVGEEYGPDLENEEYPDIYYESPKSPYQSTSYGPSPRTPASADSPDWNAWSTPPSGRMMRSPYSPEFPTASNYEDLASEEMPEMYSPPPPCHKKAGPCKKESAMSPGTAAELASFRHGVQEHTYTPHFMDKARPAMRKQVRSGQQLTQLGKKPPTRLSIMPEIEEPPESPRRIYQPAHVPEGQLVDIGYSLPMSPQDDQVLAVDDPEMQALQIQQAADNQYASLMDSPPSSRITTVREEVIEYGGGSDTMSILDQPHSLEENLKLQPALLDPDRQQLQWTSPPRDQLPQFQRYVPPPMQAEPPLTPPRFGQNIPQTFAGLDEQPPELFGTPIRRAQLFDEDYGEGVDLGGMSPQLIQSPQFQEDIAMSPIYTPSMAAGSPRTPPPRHPRTPNSSGDPRLHRTPPSGRFVYSPSMPEPVRFEEETIIQINTPAETPRRVEYVDEQVMPPRRRPRRLQFDDMPPDTPSPVKQAPQRQRMSPMNQEMSPMVQPMSPMAQPMPPMAQPMPPMAQPMPPMAQARSPVTARVGSPQSTGTLTRQSPQGQYQRSPIRSPRAVMPTTVYSEYEELQMFGGDYTVNVHDTSDIPIDDDQDDDFGWI